MNKKALSLLEIIVSTVILALIMIGMANIFVAGKQHVMHARERIASAELSKLFIDPMQMDVRQDTWGSGSNNLSITGNATTDSRIVNTRPFNSSSMVSAGNSTTTPDLRRVITNITWDEPTS